MTNTTHIAASGGQTHAKPDLHRHPSRHDISDVSEGKRECHLLSKRLLNGTKTVCGPHSLACTLFYRRPKLSMKAEATEGGLYRDLSGTHDSTGHSQSAFHKITT